MQYRKKKSGLNLLDSTNRSGIKQFVLLTLIAFFMVGCNNQKSTISRGEGAMEKRERPDQPSVDDIFKMDANNDGKLAKSELEGPLLNDFEKIDSDGDGFITKTELENAPKPKRRQGPPRNSR